jgi:hypothetical protein
MQPKSFDELLVNAAAGDAGSAYRLAEVYRLAKALSKMLRRLFLGI